MKRGLAPQTHLPGGAPCRTPPSSGNMPSSANDWPRPQAARRTARPSSKLRRRGPIALWKLNGCQRKEEAKPYRTRAYPGSIDARLNVCRRTRMVAASDAIRDWRRVPRPAGQLQNRKSRAAPRRRARKYCADRSGGGRPCVASSRSDPAPETAPTPSR